MKRRNDTRLEKEEGERTVLTQRHWHMTPSLPTYIYLDIVHPSIRDWNSNKWFVRVDFHRLFQVQARKQLIRRQRARMYTEKAQFYSERSLWKHAKPLTQTGNSIPHDKQLSTAGKVYCQLTTT